MTDSTQGGRREEILAAAEKVFEANGYAAATIDAVAAAAGVAKGSIYNYFKSKQDLFTQLFSELIARMIAGVLAEGHRNGEFTLHYEPTVAASLILAVLDGIEVHSILDVGVEVNEEFIAGLKHAVMTALTAEPRTDNPKQSGNSQ